MSNENLSNARHGDALPGITSYKDGMFVIECACGRTLHGLDPEHAERLLAGHVSNAAGDFAPGDEVPIGATTLTVVHMDGDEILVKDSRGIKLWTDRDGLIAGMNS